MKTVGLLLFAGLMAWVIWVFVQTLSPTPPDMKRHKLCRKRARFAWLTESCRILVNRDD